MRLPKYRLHKPSGRGVIQFRPLYGDNPRYLAGAFNSPESLADYERRCQEIIAYKLARGAKKSAASRNGSAGDVTINTLILGFLEHAAGHYGTAPRSEYSNVKCALRPLQKRYGTARPVEFGPLALQNLREDMIALGWSRNYINSCVNRIRRMFRWAVSAELIDGALLANLTAVPGLKKGRTKARETEPIEPVEWSVVQQVLPYVAPVVASMIEIHWLAGMRPMELCTMSAEQIDRSDNIWIYKPTHHKTLWRGKRKIICLGPQCQALIAKYWADAGYFFRPLIAVQEWKAIRRAARKTPVYGQRKLVNAKPTIRRFRPRYGTDAYQHAILNGFRRMIKTEKNLPASELPREIKRSWVEANGFAYWHPNQLRHTRATMTRATYGIEGAQAQLGNTIEATEIYAETSLALAVRIARETG